MFNIRQLRSLARGWTGYLQGLVYIELMTSRKAKSIPEIEFGDDENTFTDGMKRIRLGLGMVEAETKEEAFSTLHFLLGHELQHIKSTTSKDWNAYHKMCLKLACDRLSKRYLGKSIRLVRDSDYDKFFAELRGKGVFVNIQLLQLAINFILNSLEDGRIENIRSLKYPGFKKYKKIFRFKMWNKDNFRDADYFEEDPIDLSPSGLLRTYFGQIYFLATMGIYQKGFIGAYGTSEVDKKIVNEFIPLISRAVLAKRCRDCMDAGKELFELLLDLIIEVCTIEADADELLKALTEMLKEIMADAAQSNLSASPNDEEEGDGTPADSLFGKSELVLEVDKETYEKMQKQMEEEGRDPDEAGIKIKVKAEDENNEAEEDGSDMNSSDGGSPSDKGSDDEGDNGNSEGGNGSADTESSSNSDDKSSGDDGDASTSQDSGNMPADTIGEVDDSSETSNPGQDLGSNSEDSEEGMTGEGSCGHSNDPDAQCMDTPYDEKDITWTGLNNRDTKHVESTGLSEEELLEKLESEMAEAAKATATDFAIAEADAKLNEEFKEAASKLLPVDPASTDLSSLDSIYEDVTFAESVRQYAPSIRLPLELENKGTSLSRKIEELVKNKQEPDQRYLKSGMLDTRRLTSLAMGDISVFKKKGDVSKTDVATFLLMDNSGSMGRGAGSTRNACCNAFAVMEEGFKKHMPLKIAAFDAYGSHEVMHEVIKEFDEVCDANLSYNFRELGRDGWGNKDGYSIRVATKQLLERPEKDKILIIASDGFPTDYEDGFSEGCSDVKAAVQEARRAGIRTIGMYMYHQQNEDDFAIFRDMYAPEIIFASLEEIEDELTRVLKRYFQ